MTAEHSTSHHGDEAVGAYVQFLCGQAMLLSLDVTVRRPNSTQLTRFMHD